MAHGGTWKGFSTAKLTWGSAVGIPFNLGVWIGPDGSSVLAALNPGGYGNPDQRRPEQGRNVAQPHQRRRREIGSSLPTSNTSASATAAVPPGPRPWSGSNARGQRRSRADHRGQFRPVVQGHYPRPWRPNSRATQGELELVNHSDGSLSSEAYMKRWNRKNEQLAQAAEGAATAAAWLGVFPYPYDALYRAWDLVLGSQMHDILPGTSVPKAYEYAWNDEVLALNEFASVTERATAGVLASLDTARPGHSPSPCTTRSPSSARTPWRRWSRSAGPRHKRSPRSILRESPFPRKSSISRDRPSTFSSSRVCHRWVMPFTTCARTRAPRPNPRLPWAANSPGERPLPRRSECRRGHRLDL